MNRFKQLLLVFCCAGLFFPGVRANAADGAAALPVPPAAVTLYPYGGLISFSQSVKQTQQSDGQTGVVFALPALADPASLRIAPEGGAVTNVRWERASAAGQTATIGLRQQLDKLQQEQAQVNATLFATEARIALWTDNTDVASLVERERIDAAMDARLRALFAARYTELDRQKALGVNIAELEARIAAAEGPDNQVWMVYAALADAPEIVRITGSYMLGRCGWSPVYRFASHPDASFVEFSYEASIEQASGMDWRETPITLATVEPGVSLAPPALLPWVAEEVVARPHPVAAARMMMNVAMEKSVAADAMVPVREERGTYMVWELGKRTIPAGQPLVLPISRERWNATYGYTVRPSLDDKAYLTASVALTEPRELPQGEALFMVDGALVGKRPFRFSGTDTDIFFGSDPLVTASMRVLDKQAGDKGIVGRKQTMRWAWEITVRNNRAHAVRVAVEEPQPLSGHSDIKVEISSEPKAGVTTKDMLVWKLELAPRSEQLIHHEVIITAPKDMDVEFGRGR